MPASKGARDFLKIYDYFWLCWVFVAPHGLSLVGSKQGLLSACGVWASDCGGHAADHGL